jgi:hypothetical protein
MIATNIIRRKEKKLKEQQEIRTLCEEMLKDATGEDIPTLQAQIKECQRLIDELILEIRSLKAN